MRSGATRTNLGLVSAVIIAGVALWLATIHYKKVAPPQSWPAATQQHTKVAGEEPVGPAPSVEPVAVMDLPKDVARAINKAVPFSTATNPPATPFQADLQGISRERATDCLATAMIYEAGDDADAERAVGQVVLNRVRHPAFPSSVCGVVFQGSERQTGCQFTFACDGALQRYTPPPAAWARARHLAIAALGGMVFPQVGYATHYHTDWVVPYWSAKLDKVAALKTHLFFRWPGDWGRPRAFLRRADVVEPIIAALASRSTAHQVPSLSVDSTVLTAADAPAAATSSHAGTSTTADIARIELPSGVSSGRYAINALTICGTRARCQLVGWADTAAVPQALDSGSLASHPPDFVFVQRLADRVQRAWWSCARFPRPDHSQCIDAATIALLVN